MKKTVFTIITGLTLIFLFSCEPQADKIGGIAPPPSNASIVIDATDPFNPYFSAVADNGFICYWDFGNGQKLVGPQKVSSYYPFPNTYNAVSYTHLRAHETVLDLVC